MSKPATIRIVYKLPGFPAEVRTIENTLEAIQKLVGGYIDCVRFGERTHAYVDDEGLFKEYAVNFYYGLQRQPIVGPAVFSQVDGEGEEIGFESDEAALRVCQSINRKR